MSQKLAKVKKLVKLKKMKVSRGEFGRFWKYNNFHLRISLWVLLRPPVARYGEAAIVWLRATCLQWTLH